jgi:hypothetical protein
LFQPKKPEEFAISAKKFLKEVIEAVIMKSIFKDAKNITNSLLAKIRINAAYVQRKKNLPIKEHY